MARRYSHRPLFPNPVVSFFLFWLGYILNGSTLPPSVTFCTARYVDEQTLSLDDSIALTRVRPPKSTKNDRVLDASWTLGRPLPTGRLFTGKGGVLLHFNHVATVSTRWRAQNLFECLAFTTKYMYRLAAEVHQIR